MYINKLSSFFDLFFDIADIKIKCPVNRKVNLQKEIINVTFRVWQITKNI